MTRKRLAVLAAGAVVVAAMPASHAASDDTVLHLEGDGGYQWVAVRFVTDTETVAGTFTVEEAEHPRHSGVAVYDERDRAIAGVSVTESASNDVRVVTRVGVEEADTEVRPGPIGDPSTSSPWMEFSVNPTSEPMTRLAVV